mmetsp:Transcript_19858/g.43442  ORF Transcript_19858/g.43442 Transcript_19858/m.43442 type:complete len:326 (-) Transcript_19858:294-1271(-)|eukprot:CAMPEP_0118933300 /NCGR_PEP_ID=MMETSP1169-20130426/11910_1 /TAXON_ID=36882 /ORGANISM="Pyramimonas obovata, Strain CCMP722" /LENGTH=325 /DNA_ID=CAMNT_0006876041 /DNA_START=85 /DNA_END=1062 /DNA_ORIENTATION=+
MRLGVLVSLGVFHSRPAQPQPAGMGLGGATVVLQAWGETNIGYGPLKNENQDEFAVHEMFAGSKAISYYAVWDGHGAHGKVVAQMAKKRVTEVLEEALKTSGQNKMLTADQIKAALRQSFETANAEVRSSGIDCSRSGTTSTVALVYGNQLFVASAGDSRAVLGVVDDTEPSGERLRSEAMSIDHRPSRPSEKERLIEAGGRVEPRRAYNGNFIGEERLWLKDIQTPGLMVSRSIGDSTAAEVGCTSTPEIQQVTIDGSQKFVVLASDGIWDVLDNQFVIEMVQSKSDIKEACSAIVEAAIERWEDKCAADNITAVIVRFSDTQR